MVRVGLQIKVVELARLAGIGKNSVTRFEKGRHTGAATIRKIENALERAGATFFADAAGGPGVAVLARPNQAADDGHLPLLSPGLKHQPRGSSPPKRRPLHLYRR